MAQMYYDAMSKLAANNQVSAYFLYAALILVGTYIITIKSPARKYISWVSPAMSVIMLMALWIYGATLQ